MFSAVIFVKGDENRLFNIQKNKCFADQVFDRMDYITNFQTPDQQFFGRLNFVSLTESS